MTRDDAAALPGDLLLQAVEGMDRPLFVLDEDWRFRYMNPAGAALLGETVDELVGRVIWEEYPEAVDSPFEQNYRRVAATGEPASFEAWFDPLGIWFQVDAFRTEGGLVVTYDDVTAAPAHRGGAGRGGRPARGDRGRARPPPRRRRRRRPAGT